MTEHDTSRISIEQAKKSFESAIKFFIMTCKIQKDNSVANKQVATQKETLKEILLQHFTVTNRTYIQMEGKYVLLKTRTSKPPMNSELLTACYIQYQQTILKRQACPNLVGEAEMFAKFCTTTQTNLSTKCKDLMLTDKQPLCALFQG